MMLLSRTLFLFITLVSLVAVRGERMLDAKRRLRHCKVRTSDALPSSTLYAGKTAPGVEPSTSLTDSIQASSTTEISVKHKAFDTWSDTTSSALSKHPSGIVTASSFAPTSTPSAASSSGGDGGRPQPNSSNCFPALGFKMPTDVPEDTSNWWCDPASEYAFLGFSYEVTACGCLDYAIQ